MIQQMEVEERMVWDKDRDFKSVEDLFRVIKQTFYSHLLTSYFSSKTKIFPFRALRMAAFSVSFKMYFPQNLST